MHVIEVGVSLQWIRSTVFLEFNSVVRVEEAFLHHCEAIFIGRDGRENHGIIPKSELNELKNP